MKKTAQTSTQTPKEQTLARFEAIKAEWGKKYPAPVVIFIAEMTPHVAEARVAIRQLAAITKPLLPTDKKEFNPMSLLDSLKTMKHAMEINETLIDLVAAVAVEKAQRLGILTAEQLKNHDACQELINEWMDFAGDADTELTKLYDELRGKTAKPETAKPESESDENCDCPSCTVRRALESAIPGLKEASEGKDMEIHVIH